MACHANGDNRQVISQAYRALTYSDSRRSREIIPQLKHICILISIVSIVSIVHSSPRHFPLSQPDSRVPSSQFSQIDLALHHSHGGDSAGDSAGGGSSRAGDNANREGARKGKSNDDSDSDDHIDGEDDDDI